MASKTFIAGGTNNNWNTANNWSPVASVPANGDDVIFNASSPNCSLNVNSANLNSIDMTGYVNTFTYTGKSTLTITGTAGQTTVAIIDGSSFSVSSLSISPVSNAVINFSAICKVVATKFIGSGTVSLQRDLNCGGFGLSLTSGTFITNGYSITCGQITAGSGFTFNCTNSTINSTVGWSLSNETGFTLIDANSTWIFNILTTAGNTFSTGGSTSIGLTYSGNIMVIGGGSGILSILCGTNGVTFTGKVTVSPPRTIYLDVKGIYNFYGNLFINGNNSKYMTILNLSPPQKSVLSMPWGIMEFDWLHLSNVTAQGGASWYAGENSVNFTGNSGWIFTKEPSQPNTLLIAGN